MDPEIDFLINNAPNEEKETLRNEMLRFSELYRRCSEEAESSMNWSKINPPKNIAMYSNKDEISMQEASEILSQLVVVKLNGGLGTSMGCKGPKSAISVRNEFTFLDLTVQQIENLNRQYNCDVPLVLMNSFNTHEDTQKILGKYKQVKVRIYTFNQSRFPRIIKESFQPLPNMKYDDPQSWYPPGHGDVYGCFHRSGLLQYFLDAGCKYMFLSNIDNLGATVDLHIVKSLMNRENGDNPEFVMEVTEKTRADVKGGTLVEYDGKLRLLEIAQVAKEHVDDFKSVTKFKIFNTNNLWIKLEAIKKVVEEKTLCMEIIVNHKTLDNGINVMQLETAAGAAIASFKNAIGIQVPRSRFLPVKTTSDLLLIMSNLYTMRSGGLEMSPQRSFPSVPLVKLGDTFKTVKDFLARFSSIPDMLELDHLTVAGDVTLGKRVVLKGTVIIIANHGSRIDIPAGSVLENKIVSGNLRIMDH
ncbi:UTP--glucose-1-phosphate uridylyltransferase-like isoform X1 [Argonauta hians]